MSHVKFVHWAARMSNSDKLCKSFHEAEANWCLDFNLSLLAACVLGSWPCRMWPGSKEPRLAKENIAPWGRGSAGWMPERTGSLSVGLGRRHSVTMRRASLTPPRRLSSYDNGEENAAHPHMMIFRLRRNACI